MTKDARFEALWEKAREFNFAEILPQQCVYARKFSEWAGQLCVKAAQEADIVSVNQAKVLLLDKYFEWRNAVPKSHRNRLGDNGHSCIFQAFGEAYERLKVVELSLTPPMLFLPSPSQSAPPPAQIAGVFIGRREDQSGG
jgi:hypothetical protein